MCKCQDRTSLACISILEVTPACLAAEVGGRCLLCVDVRSANLALVLCGSRGPRDPRAHAVPVPAGTLPGELPADCCLLIFYLNHSPVVSK